MLFLVLDDGETYSGLSDDCCVFDFPDGWDSDQIEHYLREKRHGRVPASVSEEETSRKIRAVKVTGDLDLDLDS